MDMTKHIRVSCAGQNFDFIRSEDLTLDDLRNEVARLMRCDPCQLIVITTDLDLETYVQSGISNPAVAITNAERVHFLCLNIPYSNAKQKDEMEGVEYTDEMRRDFVASRLLDED